MQSIMSTRCNHLSGACRTLIGRMTTPSHFCFREKCLLLDPSCRGKTAKHWARQFSRGKSSTTGGSLHPRSSFQSLFDWYSKKLDTHPILTKCISAGIISSLGNILAQGITHQQNEQQHGSQSDKGIGVQQKAFEVDFAQMGRFTLLNVTFVAPVLHHWYQFINRTVPGRSFNRVLQRTFYDEFVFSPVYLTAFLGMLWKLEGAKNQDILKMVQSECPSIIVAEWIIWVPTMVVTFRYVPVKFQVLVINIIGVVWQTFLAYSAKNAHSSTYSVGEDGDDTQKFTQQETSKIDVANEKAEKGVVRNIIAEEKMPLVLNTIVRQNTPKP
mmetsp:Transcript_3661/g.6889  ORF Transcript_3661/g.6889 Transcript_3661/m.6889 type:complete len:327 (+) Transcript_3661:119-1099(+)